MRLVDAGTVCELLDATGSGATITSLAGVIATIRRLGSEDAALTEGDLDAAETLLGSKAGRGLAAALSRDLPTSGPGERLSTFDTARIGDAAGLRVDLEDGQRRLRSVAAWEALAGDRLVPTPAGVDDHLVVTERRMHFGAAVERPDVTTADEPAEIAVVFVRVDTAQVGQGNIQHVSYQYRVQPKVELGDLLRNAAVREALSECALHPEDETLRAAAIDALLAVEPGQEADFAPHLAAEAGGRHQEGTVPTEFGVVVLHDCRNVQVGNDNRQYATVAGTITPTVEVAELFRNAPQLAEAIVDVSCRVGRPATDLSTALRSAVRGDAQEAAHLSSLENMYPSGPLRVEDRSLVTAGRYGRRISRIDLTPSLPGRMVEVISKAVG
ncbi:hypothetical protein ACFQH9_06500 [Pseudonocardia lutea]|uniref:Uncharacterized protein n=1 Tax=Pseudonocardia lutea TaxID=2172015 RepID=A0ABW1I3D0_9PSEU